MISVSAKKSVDNEANTYAVMYSKLKKINF